MGKGKAPNILEQLGNEDDKSTKTFYANSNLSLGSLVSCKAQ